jgi:hypothetical protein
MATGAGGPKIREIKSSEDVDDALDDDEDVEDETILERVQVNS